MEGKCGIYKSRHCERGTTFLTHPVGSFEGAWKAVSLEQFNGIFNIKFRGVMLWNYIEEDNLQNVGLQSICWTQSLYRTYICYPILASHCFLLLSIVFYFNVFCPIPSHTILFHPILFNSNLLYFIVFYYILFYSVLFYFSLFYFIILHFIIFYSSIFFLFYFYFQKLAFMVAWITEAPYRIILI